jgi:RNA polymerase sigma-70 factor (ECF subfamily)
MATDKELSDFLENVERRAFKQAVYAVRKDEAAFDIVQDAMIKLAEKYGDKPAAELPLLFQRILQNTIHDYFRREKVRNTWVSLFSSIGGNSEDHEDFDILETYEAEDETRFWRRLTKKYKNSRHVNAKPFSCVIGRIWMLLKRLQQWDVPREVSKLIALVQHIP